MSKVNKKIALGGIVLLLLIIYVVNYINLQSKMNSVISEDYRNEGIKVSVHYKYYIIPSTLVYNLKSISGDKSMADVFRVFLQFTNKVQSKKFNIVYLAYRGNTKFLLQGDYYQMLGEEYSWQNPIYTINHFPQHLMNIDGSSAYPEWTGGWLGVASKQMQDFNDFHRKWYLENI